MNAHLHFKKIKDIMNIKHMKVIDNSVKNKSMESGSKQAREKGEENL